MKTKTTFLVLLFGACAWHASAQPSFDSSGNGLLNGSYYLRQVFYFSNQQTGAINESFNIQGTINFNGTGSYSFSGSLLDSAASTFPTPQNFTASGNYVVSASGLGYISAINPSFSGDKIVGLVSHGIFIGSTTENTRGYNDLFIAAPVGSVATNATLKGAYAVAYMDPTFAGDALFTMNADGNGNIGTVNVTSYLGSDTTATPQTLTGVTYVFSNGAAQLKLGGDPTKTLVAGTDLLYISPDGNFIFGGSFNGFDMFAGVRAATSAPSNYDALYYQAALDLNPSTGLDSYYGALQAFSGNIIGHQRVNSPLLYGGSSDFTYYDSYKLNTDGSSDDAFGQHYLSSSDGTLRIGYGLGPYLGINVALQAPSFSGSGVYLSPVGVVNAASSAPFTAYLSPGEFLTLYGSGLAPSQASASVPFPTALNGVQVMINQRPAPIYYVSPTQISVIVPYFTESIAQIQVINHGANSNTVTELVGSTSAGVFTNNPVGGIGYAAALHPDFSVVSPTSPAKIGETIAVYLTGLGAVNPTVTDGAAAPSSPLSVTTHIPFVYVFDSAGNCPTDSNGNCVAATVTFSGLAPGFAGLYQINFTIPTGLATGDGTLEIFGLDSDTIEPLISIGSTSTTGTHAEPMAGRSLRQRTPSARPTRLNGNQPQSALPLGRPAASPR